MGFSKSIDWSAQPLPLLPREKLFSKATTIDEKIAKKNERLNRFSENFASNSTYI